MTEMKISPSSTEKKKEILETKQKSKATGERERCKEFGGGKKRIGRDRISDGIGV